MSRNNSHMERTTRMNNATANRPLPKAPATDHFDLETCLYPYWEGNTVYNESVMVVRDEQEKLPPIPLLYPADEILEVRSSDWKHLYQEGKDWKLENGMLIIPEGSSVPIMTHAEYYPKVKVENEAFDMVGGGYVVFHEGYFFYERQIAVTYRHSAPWKDFIPLYKGNLLPNTQRKLENKEHLNIVYYGDSVMCGANSTGAVNLPPYVPTFFNMITMELKAHYGYDDITIFNTANGGMNSQWGMENAEEKVAAYHPDLVVINFGINCGSNGGMVKEDHQRYMKGIIDITRKTNPNAEFILISTCMPHPQVLFTHGQQGEYEPVLLQLEGEGVAVAQVTSFHNALLRRKRFTDISGNNVNHANDFNARMIAQVCCQTLIPYEGSPDYAAGSAPVGPLAVIVPK